MTRSLKATLARVETRRLSDQIRLDNGKTLSERNRLGQFATPGGLSLAIAKHVLAMRDPAEPIDFCDPHIGTGSFFSALLQAAPSSSVRAAWGVEIDSGFADAARDLWGALGLQVFEGDFSNAEVMARVPGRPNLILTNPPYVRHHHISYSDKHRLADTCSRAVGRPISGLSGLYLYMLVLATEWMADGGLAAWLIPSEFMDVNYGSALRWYLTQRVALRSIHRFDPEEVQFDDALVTSAVVVFEKRLPSKQSMATLSYGGSLDAPLHQVELPLTRLAELRKWSHIPGTAGVEAAAALDQAEPEYTFADLFKVQRGLATGDNSFFVMPLDQALAIGIPSMFLKPIVPSPRYMKTDVINDRGDGYPAVDKPLALLDCPLPEDEVRDQFPRLWAYLQTALPRGVTDRYLVRARKPWYRQEQRRPALFLCTYMGRGTGDKQPVRFIWNRSLALAANVYLMLYPVPALEGILRDRGAQEVAFAILQNVSGHAMRAEGRVYGGGLQKMEPSEMGRLDAAPFLNTFPGLLEQLAPRLPSDSRANGRGPSPQLSLSLADST